MEPLQSPTYMSQHIGVISVTSRFMTSLNLLVKFHEISQENPIVLAILRQKSTMTVSEYLTPLNVLKGFKRLDVIFMCVVLGW